MYESQRTGGGPPGRGAGRGGRGGAGGGRGGAANGRRWRAGVRHRRTSESSTPLVSVRCSGSDTAGDGNRWIGMMTLVEMENMVAAGFTPAEVIVASTRESAKVLRIDDLGTVAAGQERRLHRPRRQSARRHQERASDCEGVSSRPGSRSCGPARQVAGAMEQGGAHQLILRRRMRSLVHVPFIPRPAPGSCGPSNEDDIEASPGCIRWRTPQRPGQEDCSMKKRVFVSALCAAAAAVCAAMTIHAQEAPAGPPFPRCRSTWWRTSSTIPPTP